MKVLVTGATGTLGRATVPALVAAGHDVRALSRSTHADEGTVTWLRGDLATGEGIAAAVAGTDVVVHLASAPYRRGYTRAVDIEGTRLLAGAVRDASVPHLLYVSIVGIDAIPWGYFRTKVAAEAVVRGAGAGWSVLRATQFHDLLDSALRAAARLPVIPVDRGIRTQPVEPADVAGVLVEMVAAGPSGRTAEYGGPEELLLEDAVRQWLAVTGVRRPLVPVRVPGRLGAAFRAGHLTTPFTPTGRTTWRDHLGARVAASPVASG